MCNTVVAVGVEGDEHLKFSGFYGRLFRLMWGRAIAVGFMHVCRVICGNQ